MLVSKSSYRLAREKSAVDHNDSDYRVRAEMVYFTAPNHGAVFSTGSIAFSQSLPYNDFDNNVSRLLNNIVTAFSREGRLPGWAWTAEEKQWR